MSTATGIRYVRIDMGYYRIQTDIGYQYLLYDITSTDLRSGFDRDRSRLLDLTISRKSIQVDINRATFSWIKGCHEVKANGLIA